MEKFAEADRLEQLTAQRQRQAKLDHRKAVDELVAARRAKRAAERAQASEEQRQKDDMERFRQQVIEQERQRLLREHAGKLAGYLPKVSTLLCRHVRSCDVHVLYAFGVSGFIVPMSAVIWSMSTLILWLRVCVCV